MRTHRSADARRPWNRRQLLAAVATVAIVICASVTGLAILLSQAVGSEVIVGGGAAGGGVSAPPPASLRDRIAAAPMVSLDPAAATQPDVAVPAAPPLRLPTSVAGRGPAGVPVFGHSVEAAVAQLASINVAVLEAMDMPYTAEVHQAWVLPGGPSLDQWDLSVNVAAFLHGARQGAARDEATTVTVVPAGALVKGTDGPDWVLACVLLDIRATIQTTYRMGWGHCARMQWSAGRWRIGPGAAPTAAPSAWPASRAAKTAGWLTWSSDEQEPVR